MYFCLDSSIIGRLKCVERRVQTMRCKMSHGQSCCHAGLRISHNFHGTRQNMHHSRSQNVGAFLAFYLVSPSAEPPELSPLSFGGDILNEGDFAQASCIVRKGDKPLAISWSFHGSNITSELGIVITPLGFRGSSLMIPTVGHKHRGTYTCKASNAAGVRTEIVDLNVNGIHIKGRGMALE